MRYPNAEWIGPTVNENVGGMVDVRGLVLHIQEGTEAGSESWFKNPAAQASSHFLNPKTGNLRQLVDTRDKAWAEAVGNSHWISVENEGYSGDFLNHSQLANVVALYSWLNQVYGVPFLIADSPTGDGLGWHGMGGTAWGNHPNCPGDPIKNQRQYVLDMASGIVVTTHGAPWPEEYLKLTTPMMHNSNVAHFQQKLHDRGYTIAVDGWFGTQTDVLTRLFQYRHLLTDDGVVGPLTWNAAES